MRAEIIYFYEFDELSDGVKAVTFKEITKIFINASRYYCYEGGKGNVGFGNFEELDSETEDILLGDVWEILKFSILYGTHPENEVEKMLFIKHYKYFINYCKKFEYDKNGYIKKRMWNKEFPNGALY